MPRFEVLVPFGIAVLLTMTAAVPCSAAGALQSDQDIEEAIRIFNRGKQLHQDRQYDQAIAEYRQAIKLDGENPFIHNAMGLALAAVGNLKEALRAFQKALSLNPDLTDVHNNMGMVYAEQGEKEKAFDAFSRVVRNPDYPTPEKALYNLGNLYFNDGNLELALVHYRRAIEREPKFALPYRGLGKVYLQQGETELAEAQFQKALENFEDDAESLFQLARLSEQRGELEEARVLYRRVVEVDRFSPFGQLAMQNLEALKKPGS